MVLGVQTEIFEDTKLRKIFHIKNTEKNYLLQEKDEFKVRLLRMNIVDSVSVAILLGLVIHMPIYAYVAVAAMVYVAYLFYFNSKVLPTMQAVKKVERKKVEEKSKDRPPFVAFAYLLVGAGLLYCMLSNQVEANLTYIVIGAMILSFGLGSFYLYLYCWRS